MLKKFFLASVASLLTLPAFVSAQNNTTITTTYPSGTTIVAGNCIISGATSFQYNPTANTITPVGGTDSCENQQGGNLTASVTASLSTSTYTIGSGASVPVLTVTTNTPAATISCTLTPQSGSDLTVTSSSVISPTDSFTLSAPTVQGTWTLKPTCTTATSGYNTAVTSNTVSITVSPNGNTGGCSSTQTAVVNGVTFQRQCSGTMNAFPNGGSYSGAFTDLGTVLGNKTFPNYSYSGQSPTFTIQSGFYVSLAFTPTVAGSLRWIANSSYGDGGTISVSTQPGQLTAASGAICSYGLGSLNNMLASTASGSCRLTLGTTYYINIADTNPNGQLLCFGSTAGSCPSSAVSYGLTAKAL